jgi:hypothetical protein
MIRGSGRVKAGELKPSPLTLHVNVGDCLKINLKNEMAKAQAGFHVDTMVFDPKGRARHTPTMPIKSIADVYAGTRSLRILASR